MLIFPYILYIFNIFMFLYFCIQLKKKYDQFLRKQDKTELIHGDIVVSKSSNLINFLMLNVQMTHPNTLEKKMYQLIISRLDGDHIHSYPYQKKISKLVKMGIGGFIVFGGRRDEVKYFIEKAQSISETTLFIASDIEHGVAQQIRDCTVFPCQMAMAAAIDKIVTGDVAVLEGAVKAISDEAKDIGINMPLIPVLDVNQNPDNPIICTRAFSDSAEDVAWFGSEYIKILESSGLLSCAKHFPGHGDTSADSHILLPVINKSYEDLMNLDMIPFKKAVDTGVSCIMIGHLGIPAVDSKPASLSKVMVTDILRKKFGFDGLVLTDALNMNALKEIENVPAQCLKAGVDILLHPDDPDLTVKELISAVKANVITERHIDNAINRILDIKKKIKYEKQQFDYKSHEKLSSLITEMSITVVKNTTGILPISDRSNIHLVFSGENNFFKASPLKTFFKDFTIITDNMDLKNKIAIFAIFTNVAAWRGSSGIVEDERKLISELIRKAKNSIVISFGSPYVLRHFREADLLVAAYEPTEQAQKAVIKCLTGELDFKGRLPVRII
jgi:beta-N-acetylhexosaminidase